MIEYSGIGPAGIGRYAVQQYLFPLTQSYPGESRKHILVLIFYYSGSGCNHVTAVLGSLHTFPVHRSAKGAISLDGIIVGAMPVESKVGCHSVIEPEGIVRLVIDFDSLCIKTGP